MTELSISIIIPTFQRPSGLLVAARSVFKQTMLDKTDCTLIIVDNDPAASASASIETLRAEAPANLRFIAEHEPAPGVANARNRAMDLLDTDLIAFLDDDQSAQSPDWLEKLYALHLELKPAVVFGPLITVLPDDITKHRDYFFRFFGRADKSRRGLIKHYHGGCNTLIDVASLPTQRPIFDPDTNDTGGEDDLLFIAIEQKGGKFAWEPDANVLEHVIRKRLSLKYTLKRAFVYGQGPCTEARLERNYFKLAFWMAVGAGKFALHGTRGAIGYLFKSKQSAQQIDLAIRGLSKVVFWKRIKLYGAPALVAVPEQAGSEGSPDIGHTGVADSGDGQQVALPSD
jgi:glycosyltransferase involved in cell wall biosynthesis